MRLNRLAQIGLVVIVGALLLWVGVKVFGNKPQPVVAQNDANATNVIPVSANSQPGQPPRSIGRGYKPRFYIPERTLLTRDMFQEGTLDPNDDNSNFVTDFLTQAYGYITDKPIAPTPNRNLRRDDLRGSVRELGLSAVVQDGYRAITIAIPNKTTLHDIVSIGDYVDVMATFDQVETRVLADGVKVLAVDVYGRDYEKAPVAKRGTLSGGPGAPVRPDPNATPVPGQPVTPEGEPQPTPVPQGQQPAPVAREAALTLEVKPEQAAAIALASASAAVLDYLIQPRPSTQAAPQLTEARITKAQVAPYALASKRGSGTKSEPAAKAPTITKIARDSNYGSSWSGSQMPTPSTSTGLPPARIDNYTRPDPAPKPKTYDIVIYPDGLPPRVNTVPIPK